jgi:hypothetical protein
MRGTQWHSGWGTALQDIKSRDRFPMVSLEFFIDIPSSRTVALGSTQPLTEMSTRNISWGKGNRCHLHVPIVLNSGGLNLNLLEPSGSVKAYNVIAFAFTYVDTAFHLLCSFCLLDIQCIVRLFMTLATNLWLKNIMFILWLLLCQLSLRIETIRVDSEMEDL